MAYSLTNKIQKLLESDNHC